MKPRGHSLATSLALVIGFQKAKRDNVGVQRRGHIEGDGEAVDQLSTNPAPSCNDLLQNCVAAPLNLRQVASTHRPTRILNTLQNCVAAPLNLRQVASTHRPTRILNTLGI
jgi:hypothetical protein